MVLLFIAKASLVNAPNRVVRTLRYIRVET
jgi:hypothetical protein